MTLDRPILFLSLLDELLILPKLLYQHYQFFIAADDVPGAVLLQIGSVFRRRVRLRRSADSLLEFRHQLSHFRDEDCEIGLVVASLIIISSNVVEDFEVLVDDLEYTVYMELINLLCADVKEQPVQDLKVCLMRLFRLQALLKVCDDAVRRVVRGNIVFILECLIGPLDLAEPVFVKHCAMLVV